MKAFPIPVVALGPGTQTEDESLDYLPMPKDMDTYRAPMLPGMMPSCPALALTAPLRVTYTSCPK